MSEDELKRLKRERDQALTRRDDAYQLASIRLHMYEKVESERNRLRARLDRCEATLAMIREACQKPEIAEHGRCHEPGCGLCKLQALFVAGDIGRGC